MKPFTVNKRGEYYNLEYIGFENPNIVFKIHKSNNLYFNTKKQVLDFISYVIKLEKELDALNSKHNTQKLIRFYLRQIESISSGLDIRSKWTIKEFAEVIVNWFDTRYDEAVVFCQDTITWTIENDCNILTDWRRFEKHDRFVKIFELDFPELDRLLEKSKELLELIKKSNEKLGKDKN
jgi:hypothetical protein